MTLRSAGVLGITLVAASGCSAREACSLGTTDETVESNHLTGSRVFSVEGERESLPLSLALRGLPELWASDGAVEGARLSVHLAFAYGNVPANGRVEMPSIGVFFGGNDGGFGASGPYPSAMGLTFSTFIFETCVGAEDDNCCDYGSRECRLRGTLGIERLEGEPFPPLGVTWDVGTSANVNDCPLGGSNPELEVELVPP